MTASRFVMFDQHHTAAHLICPDIYFPICISFLSTHPTQLLEQPLQLINKIQDTVATQVSGMRLQISSVNTSFGAQVKSLQQGPLRHIIVGTTAAKQDVEMYSTVGYEVRQYLYSLQDNTA